jgi:septal ring factor EnvC (AmiA/AmiB activator)
MASFIMFERINAGDVRPIQVGYVHVQDIRVEVGDTVTAGQVVARIGNNGISDYPMFILARSMGTSSV